MKIDWKTLAKSDGYRSIKKALIRDVTEASRRDRPMRKKEEFHKLFRWVMARAQHYAARQGRSVEQVLNEWESTRDYWWLGLYSDHRLPKLPSGRPRNVKPKKHYYFSRNPIDVFREVRIQRTGLARNLRKQAGKPARWGAERKRKQREFRARRKQSL